MKFIKFAGEVMRVPKSVTFWLQSRDGEDSAPYSINMSPLEPKNAMGDHSFERVIRREWYTCKKDAHERLDHLLMALNR